MTKQDIIDAAMQIALAGGDGHTSPVIDSHMTAEDLLPLALRHAYGQLLHSGSLSLQDVLRAHTIEIVDGEGELPEGVLTEHLDQSFLPDFPYSAYLPLKSDYDRERFNAMLCYYTVNNGRFYTSCVEQDSGSGSEESSEEGETIVLHAPSIPVLPNSAATDIVMPQRALDTVIQTLALAIRGDLKLVQ